MSPAQKKKTANPDTKPSAQPSGATFRKLEGVLAPVLKFIQNQVTSSVLLLGATFIALIVANSASAHAFHHFWETPVTLGFGSYSLTLTLHHWINDGLMAIFFTLVGLEIKIEIVEGELAGLKKALLPIGAAVGGMVLPAAIYMLFNHTDPVIARGWGIPMATDIAFALMMLSVLGSKVPSSLKVFLAALAIADDLGAVLVIAFFYTEKIHVGFLLVGGLLALTLFLLNGLKVRTLGLYIGVALGIWLCFLQAGVHPTMAGVLLAMSLPIRPRGGIDESRKHLQELHQLTEKLVQTETEIPRGCRESDELINRIQYTGWMLESPLQNLLHKLEPISNYFVMPVFALANAGITLEASALEYAFSSLGLGIFFGLVFGKPIGITLFTWLVCKLNLAQLPGGIHYRQVFGAGILAGIGFTVSVFIANLSFSSSEAMLGGARLAILVASFVAAAVGYLFLTWQGSPAQVPPATDEPTGNPADSGAVA
jgi:NhaA family Na+:H+ antiporter